MGKFGRLIKNEYIKLFVKISTIIMLILVLLAGVGFVLISKVSADATVSEEVSAEERKSSYELELEQTKKAKADGWEAEAEWYSYILDNELYNYDWNHWRFEAAYWLKDAMYQAWQTEQYGATQSEIAESKELVASLKDLISMEDWKAFCNFYIANVENYADLLALSETAVAAQKQKYTYCLDHNIEPRYENDLYAIACQLAQVKEELADLEASAAAGGTVDQAEVQTARDNVLLYSYRLENDIAFDISENPSWVETYTFDFWSVFNASANMLSLVGVLMIVVAGSIVSTEFSQGTIKFLLINPVKRWKILVAKYVTAISLGYLMLLLLYIVAFVASLIFFGDTAQLDASYYYVSGDVVKSIPGFLFVLKNYLLGSVNVLMMSTLAFAISSLLRSNAVSIGISMLLMMVGSTITSVLAMLGFDWGRYLIFANTDLITIADGFSPFLGHTVGFAVVVNLIHLFLFGLIAWDGFVRREV